MRCTLTRLDPSDGAGIVGGMTMLHFKFDEDGKLTETRSPKEPTVGWQILIENLSYWYRTSPITKILTERDTDAYREVIFKTENSTYSWKDYK